MQARLGPREKGLGEEASSRSRQYLVGQEEQPAQPHCTRPFLPLAVHPCTQSQWSNPSAAQMLKQTSFHLISKSQALLDPPSPRFWGGFPKHDCPRPWAPQVPDVATKSLSPRSQPNLPCMTSTSGPCSPCRSCSPSSFLGPVTPTHTLLHTREMYIPCCPFLDRRPIATRAGPSPRRSAATPVTCRHGGLGLSRLSVWASSHTASTPSSDHCFT